MFHNRVVDLVCSKGTSADRVFAEANRIITWHCQWIIVNEFLPQIIGFGLT